MIKAILTTALLLFSFSLFSQVDSTKYVTYDVVVLKVGGRLKGEIMSFDEPSGGLVFKDLKGRIYSLSRAEYAYFEKNQYFPIKNKEFVLKQRKTDEFALELGVDFSILMLNQHFDNSENILYDNHEYFDMPVGLKIAGGKYFNAKHYAGITLEYAIVSESQSLIGGGLRYKYFYDSQKKNLGLYIPIELKFISVKGNSFLTLNDTTYTEDGYSWPTDYDVQTNLQAVTLGLGHGFAFLMSNKKLIALEFSVHTYFGLKEEYAIEKEIMPDRKFSGYGFKGGVYFQF